MLDDWDPQYVLLTCLGWQNGPWLLSLLPDSSVMLLSSQLADPWDSPLPGSGKIHECTKFSYNNKYLLTRIVIQAPRLPAAFSHTTAFPVLPI